MKAIVVESGFVAGEYHKEGEVLELTERQFQTGVRRGRVKGVTGVKAKENNAFSSDDDDDVSKLRVALDKLGVAYHHKMKAPKLKELLEEAEGL